MTIFADHVDSERRRLTAAMLDATSRSRAIADEIDGYRRELAGLDAYEATVNGKTTSAKGAKQQTLLTMLKGSTGMTRAQIIEKIGVAGDKKAEAALSNTLATMKKKRTITLTGGTYTAA